MPALYRVQPHVDEPGLTTSEGKSTHWTRPLSGTAHKPRIQPAQHVNLIPRKGSSMFTFQTCRGAA
jgi:hypothetical protein